MPARKTTDTVGLKLRLRESLRRQIEKSAKENKVSLNTEMLRLLERGLERENWEAERLNLLTILGQAMQEHPKLAEIRKQLEDADEKDFLPTFKRILDKKE